MPRLTPGHRPPPRPLFACPPLLFKKILLKNLFCVGAEIQEIQYVPMYFVPMYWKFRSFIFISYFENSYFTSLKSFENCSSFENHNFVHLRFRIQLTSVSCIVIRHCTSYKKKQGLSSSARLLFSGTHQPPPQTASASDLFLLRLRICACASPAASPLLSSSSFLLFPPLSSRFERGSQGGASFRTFTTFCNSN